MRAHQISPKTAKSVESPMRLIAVPIRCHCIAPGDNGAGRVAPGNIIPRRPRIRVVIADLR